MQVRQDRRYRQGYTSHKVLFIEHSIQHANLSTTDIFESEFDPPPLVCIDCSILVPLDVLVLTTTCVMVSLVLGRVVMVETVDGSIGRSFFFIASVVESVEVIENSAATFLQRLGEGREFWPAEWCR